MRGRDAGGHTDSSDVMHTAFLDAAPAEQLLFGTTSTPPPNPPTSSMERKTAPNAANFTDGLFLTCSLDLPMFSDMESYSKRLKVHFFAYSKSHNRAFEKVLTTETPCR